MTGPSLRPVVLFVSTTFVACVEVGGQGRVPEPRTAPGSMHLGFEPPLLGDGRLLVRHEAGPSTTLATACTGVRLSLPPGPVFLRLEAAGRVFERTLVVDPQCAEVVWVLSPP